MIALLRDVVDAIAGGHVLPCFTPYRAAAQRLAPNLQRGQRLAAALNQALSEQPPIALRAGRLRFAEPAELPPGEPYEAFIARSACVPTRDNLHDLFNALVWLTFPSLKRRLNEAQATEIARAGIGITRGAARDALTLFDENGALWPAPPPPLAAALRQRDWHALFITHRALWRGAEPLLVGHALLEKLLRPRKAIAAHLWCLPIDADARRLVDGPHLPLPVLGVPGWWPANETPGFYVDAAVFRPLR